MSKEDEHLVTVIERDHDEAIAKKSDYKKKYAPEGLIVRMVGTSFLRDKQHLGT